MNQKNRLIIAGIVAVAVVGGLLYLTGIRVSGPRNTSTVNRDSSGAAKGQPGWRQAVGQGNEKSGVGQGSAKTGGGMRAGWRREASATGEAGIELSNKGVRKTRSQEGNKSASAKGSSHRSDTASGPAVPGSTLGQRGSGQPEENRLLASASGGSGTGKNSPAVPGGGSQGTGRTAQASRVSGSGQGEEKSGKQGSGQNAASNPMIQSQVGVATIFITVSGKEKATFTGNDLSEHVEDTVIATSEGALKGWSVANTLKYFGIDPSDGAALITRNGEQITLSLQQIQDKKTLFLLGYDATGHLILVSGPKVRGTGKGQTSLESVVQMVDGRQDLLHVSDIVKIEVRG